MPKTLRRIARGIAKFVLDNPRPFIVPIQHYGAGAPVHSVDAPLRTITAHPKGGAFALVAAHLTHFYSSNTRGGEGDLGKPLKTITATGQHAGLVTAFLTSYYGSSLDGRDVQDPLPTVTTKDRMSVVRVEISGQPYVIVDIGMRMLEPDELLRAQFGEYAEGYVLHGSKSDQVAMIGNSVPPHLAHAIVAANYKPQHVTAEAAA